MHLNLLGARSIAQYSDVIWASWGLKSTTVWLFVQAFDQADIKDNI